VRIRILWKAKNVVEKGKREKFYWCGYWVGLRVRARINSIMPIAMITTAAMISKLSMLPKLKPELGVEVAPIPSVLTR